MWKDFRAFLARGNVVDLAVAVVIGAAFGKIVTTFVDGVLMPPIGLLLGKVDFSSLFFVLDSSQGIPASLAEAKARGIPVIAYGALVNDVINFVIVAFAVFLLVRAVARMQRQAEAAPGTKESPYCYSTIALKATKCPACTSPLG